jgi:hypothetical protein
VGIIKLWKRAVMRINQLSTDVCKDILVGGRTLEGAGVVYAESLGRVCKIFEDILFCSRSDEDSKVGRKTSNVLHQHREKLAAGWHITTLIQGINDNNKRPSNRKVTGRFENEILKLVLKVPCTPKGGFIM